MRLYLYVLFSLGLFSCNSSDPMDFDNDDFKAVTTSSSICSIEIPGYIQILVRDVVAGITSVNAFRLSEFGSLSHASWDVRGTFVVSSGNASLSSDTYGRTLNTLSELSLHSLPDDGTLRQPGGVSYEVAIVSPDSIEYQSGPLGAEALIPILDEWGSETTLNSVSGNYYWTSPIGGSGTEDIDIDNMGCEDPLSQALVEGIVSDDVLIPAPEILTTNYSSDAGRPNILASTPLGRVFFGVVPFQ